MKAADEAEKIGDIWTESDGGKGGGGADGVGSDGEGKDERGRRDERDEGPSPGSLSARLSVAAAGAEAVVSETLEAMTRSSFVTSSDQRTFVFGEGEVGIVLVDEENRVDRLEVKTLAQTGLGLRQGIQVGDFITHVNHVPLRKLSGDPSPDKPFHKFVLQLIARNNSQRTVSVSVHRKPPPEDQTKEYI